MSTFSGGKVIGVGKRLPEQSVYDIDPRGLKEATLTDLADVCSDVLSRKEDLHKLIAIYGKAVEDWIKQGPQRALAQEIKETLKIDSRTLYLVAFHIYTSNQAAQDGMVQWDEPTIAQQWTIPRDQQFAAGHLTELSLGMGIKPVFTDRIDGPVWLELFETALKTHRVSLLLFSRKIYDQYVMSRPGFFQELFKSFDPIDRYQSIPWYHSYDEFVRILESIVAVDFEAVRLLPDAKHQWSGQIFKLYHPSFALIRKKPDPELLKKFVCINPEVLKIQWKAIDDIMQDLAFMTKILKKRPETVQWIQSRLTESILKNLQQSFPEISKYLSNKTLDRVHQYDGGHTVIEHVT